MLRRAFNAGERKKLLFHKEAGVKWGTGGFAQYGGRKKGGGRVSLGGGKKAKVPWYPPKRVRLGVVRGGPPSDQRGFYYQGKERGDFVKGMGY